MSRDRAGLVALVAVLAAVLAGCSGNSTEAGTQTTEPESITVFAAASLRSTFTELGQRFEAQHPGTRVVFNFAGSSELFTQLDQGAPGDVFASADTANMTKARGAGLTANDPVNFATNVLTIAVPPGNPAHVTSFADLARPDVKVVVCAPQVPCGNATKRVEDATGVNLKPVSEESSVTDVLGKVVTGQADAGLVYVTDAAGAGDKVTAVPFPEAAKVVNTYPIATLRESGHPDLAGQFVDLVIGRDGRQVLSRAGFGTP
ncbi:molybdate ABC transporter substrate-binding protein [Rhodococcus sp. SGAir0479]|uniref:molybdate ABC transporter substrate-binding protein n=1 Tax=Rhodococcus sp. SGAir0479 TaxID=2567884 RepID=UPI0010CCDD5D|nr:molybdate ABC transporter substrate-binding protein [Rhodococcus sp. SGAir0479]QCQ93025.1 molybdate ABC transporter substrate-binding protein [Rhodococcus sp. SGAir0479]